MEQQIRFCKTTDGVQIAYATSGQRGGPPMVMISGWVSHLEYQWEDPIFRQWFDAYHDHFLLVRYDKRGTGLSDRGYNDYSVETRLLDLEAVVKSLDLDRFFLLGVSEGGPLAIIYAARNPERVIRLALYGTFASPFGNPAATEALVALVRAEWGLGSATMSNIFMPGASAEEAARFGKVQRVSATPEDAADMLQANTRVDVEHLLPEVQAPTLVLHARGDKAVPFEQGRKIAGAIPDARLIAIDSDRHWPEPDNMKRVTDAVTEFFLAGLESPAGPETETSPGSFRAVLFTDLVGHTEMMSRRGDERGRAVLREHERITRETLAANGGTEVKTMGDGFMASFGSVTKAVQCAIALQRAFSPGVRFQPDGGAVGDTQPEPLSVRVGLNAGEPIEEDNDLFGATVILASRIAAKADGGEILVSDNVRSLCSGKGFLFADRGEFVAKGFEDPVRVYEVSWRD